MSKPLGQKVDCDVCIAKAGHPCFMQPEYGESVYSQYVPGDAYWPERFHVGVRLRADDAVTDLLTTDVPSQDKGHLRRKPNQKEK